MSNKSACSCLLWFVVWLVVWIVVTVAANSCHYAWWLRLSQNQYIGLEFNYKINFETKETMVSKHVITSWWEIVDLMSLEILVLGSFATRWYPTKFLCSTVTQDTFPRFQYLGLYSKTFDLEVLTLKNGCRFLNLYLRVMDPLSNVLVCSPRNINTKKCLLLQVGQRNFIEKYHDVEKLPRPDEPDWAADKLLVPGSMHKILST